MQRSLKNFLANTYMLKRFIEQLVNDLKLTPPDEPPTGGGYVLRFEPVLTFTLKEHAMGTLKAQAVLAPIPEAKKSEYLLFAMEANLFGQETGENFLGIDGDEKHVTLTQLIDPTIGYPEFKRCLEEFLNYCETWRTDTKLYA